MNSRRPEPVPPPSSPPSPPLTAPGRVQFRFSLKTLLWTVTGFAVLMGLGVTAPWLLEFILSAVFVALPAVLTMGIVYGHDDLRAFCIGGLFPAGMKALGRWDGPTHLFLSSRGFAAIASVAVSVAATGVLCVWVRRAIQRRYG